MLASHFACPSVVNEPDFCPLQDIIPTSLSNLEGVEGALVEVEVDHVIDHMTGHVNTNQLICGTHLGVTVMEGEKDEDRSQQ